MFSMVGKKGGKDLQRRRSHPEAYQPQRKKKPTVRARKVKSDMTPRCHIGRPAPNQATPQEDQENIKSGSATPGGELRRGDFAT